jgi:hypothetical protein
MRLEITGKQVNLAIWLTAAMQSIAIMHHSSEIGASEAGFA